MVEKSDQRKGAQMEEDKTSKAPLSEPIDMLTINPGMDRQLRKSQEEKIEHAKLSEDEPLKVRVDSKEDRREIEKLTESIGATTVIDQRKREAKKKKGKEKASEEGVGGAIKATVKDLTENVNKAKIAMKKLEGNMNEEERNRLKAREEIGPLASALSDVIDEAKDMITGTFIAVKSVFYRTQTETGEMKKLK